MNIDKLFCFVDITGSSPSESDQSRFSIFSDNKSTKLRSKSWCRSAYNIQSIVHSRWYEGNTYLLITSVCIWFVADNEYCQAQGSIWRGGFMGSTPEIVTKVFWISPLVSLFTVTPEDQRWLTALVTQLSHFVNSVLTVLYLMWLCSSHKLLTVNWSFNPVKMVIVRSQMLDFMV